ncbi:hypothetical protein [uncultured Sphingomonas sp.]|uniref:hypothetical protein n=1 Tax=uncultured Sphingomonas sp. TaxID=158754 RepID=UPI0035CA3C82
MDPRWVNALGYLERAAALAALGSATIVLSALSYVFVERPLIASGKRRDEDRPTARKPLTDGIRAVSSVGSVAGRGH